MRAQVEDPRNRSRSPMPSFPRIRPAISFLIGLSVVVGLAACVNGPCWPATAPPVKKDVLISFRIDDITFRTWQKHVLQTAAELARDYGITWDLNVIAKPFEEKGNPSVFSVYERNQDIFEIAAHGYDHKNPLDPSHADEFYDLTSKTAISAEIQEDHMRRMRAIFREHGLWNATQILILPWSAGDDTTLRLANRYGYKIVTQDAIPNKALEEKVDGTIVTRVKVVVANTSATLTSAALASYQKRICKYVDSGFTSIQIELHPPNLLNHESCKQLLDCLVRRLRPDIAARATYGKISQRLGPQQVRHSPAPHLRQTSHLRRQMPHLGHDLP